MANLKRFLLLLPILSFAACEGLGSRLDTTLEKPTSHVEGLFLEGSAPAIEGEAIQLSSYSKAPLLLTFAGDTCSVCAEETDNLVKNQSKLTPHNLQIVTILAGADAQIAKEWAQDHGVTWKVGFDENIELFKKNCPAGTTPCNFIQVPGKGVVLMRSGPISIEEIISYISTK